MVIQKYQIRCITIGWLFVVVSVQIGCNAYGAPVLCAPYKEVIDLCMKVAGYLYEYDIETVVCDDYSFTIDGIIGQVYRLREALNRLQCEKRVMLLEDVEYLAVLISKVKKLYGGVMKHVINDGKAGVVIDEMQQRVESWLG
ncbi:MAG: hypothetical protein WBQ73_00345 [Candidatus Babeliales bacterium]